jgi:hypothetical protein
MQERKEAYENEDKERRIRGTIKGQATNNLTYGVGVEDLESLADVHFAGGHTGFLLFPALSIGFGLQLRLLECLFSGLEFGLKIIGSLQGNDMGGF